MLVIRVELAQNMKNFNQNPLRRLLIDNKFIVVKQIQLKFAKIIEKIHKMSIQIWTTKKPSQPCQEFQEFSFKLSQLFFRNLIKKKNFPSDKFWFFTENFEERMNYLEFSNNEILVFYACGSAFAWAIVYCFIIMHEILFRAYLLDCEA